MEEPPLPPQPYQPPPYQLLPAADAEGVYGYGPAALAAANVAAIAAAAEAAAAGVGGMEEEDEDEEGSYFDDDDVDDEVEWEPVPAPAAEQQVLVQQGWGYYAVAPPPSHLAPVWTAADRVVKGLEEAVRRAYLDGIAAASQAAAAVLGADPRFGPAFATPAGVLARIAFGKERETPLMIASRWNNSPLAEMLLRPVAEGGCGADPNVRDERGGTALNRACLGGHMECVQLLIRAGAHVFPPQAAATETQYTPLMEAVVYERTRLVRFLLDHYRAHAGTPARLTAALDHLSFRDQSAVYGAAREGAFAEARMLLAEGAWPGGADYAGRTPHGRARSLRYEEVALMIESAAAEPDRPPLLGKVRVISDARHALKALLAAHSLVQAPPMDGPAAVALVARAVAPCFQPRVRAAAAAAACAAADNEGEGDGEGALVCCVLAAMRALPRVTVVVPERVSSSFYESVHCSPKGTRAARRRRLDGVVRGVMNGALREELFKEMLGFMYPRWTPEEDLPWHLQGRAVL